MVGLDIAQGARADAADAVVPVPRLCGVAARDSIRLAFVAALQHLPARQRAVLILRDVLAWRAAEVADLLEITTAAVNSALQRARAQLQEVAPDRDCAARPAGQRQRELADRYVAAFVDADVAALTRLLADEVVLEMPPFRAIGRSWVPVLPGRCCAAGPRRPAGSGRPRCCRTGPPARPNGGSRPCCPARS
jgi:predicted transcriptional regulator